MKKNAIINRVLSFALSIIMVFSLLAIIPATSAGIEAEAKSYSNNGVITAWYTAMTNLNGDRTYEKLVDPYFNGNSIAVGIVNFKKNSTFRSSINLAAGGTTFRVKLTNYYGSENMNVSKMNVALPGSGNATSIDTGSIVNIRVNGSTSFTIPKGGYVWTDWFTMKSSVAAGGKLVFSTYVANSGKVRDSGLTGGNSYAFSGDRTTSAEEKLAAIGHLISEDPAVGNYDLVPLLNCVEVQKSNSSDYAVMVIGDSTVTNSIPSLIQANLRSHGVRNVAVLGAGIKGNELLQDGAGGDGPLEGDAMVYKNADGTYRLGRFDMDALSVTGVKKIFIKIGINDIVHPDCSNLVQYYNGSSDRPGGYRATADDIIGGYKYMIEQAHARGIEVYFFDITPFQGYTREDTVVTNQAEQNIVDTVNKWLADNQRTVKDSDNMDIDPIEGYSFGYIPVSELVGEPANNGTTGLKIKDAYTLDYIHFLANAQIMIANQVPVSIFKGVSDEPVENEQTIKNLYAATQEITAGGYYFMASSLNVNTSHNTTSGNPGNSSALRPSAADQQDTAYLAASNYNRNGSTPTQSWHAGSNYPGAYFGKPVVDLLAVQTTMQRGTGGAPYIALQSSVINGITVPDGTAFRAAYWQRTNAEATRIKWTDYQTNRNLAYYFCKERIVGQKIAEFDLGSLVQSDDLYYSPPIGEDLFSKWFSLNTVAPGSDYESQVYYASTTSAGNKFLTFGNAITSNSNATQGFLPRVLNTDVYRAEYNSKVTLLTAASANTKMELTSEVSYNAKAGEAAKIGALLTDDLYSKTYNSDGVNVTTLSNYSDFASCQSFVGYTYGENRSVSAVSDNEEVAKVEGNNVVFTGEAGEAKITVTYTWKELDGTTYTMKDTVTVTNVVINTDINIDGAYPDEYEIENFGQNASKAISVDYSVVPAYGLPEGGSWVWSGSNDSVIVTADSKDPTKAVVTCTDKAGTANITAAYVANGVTYCSDTVKIINTTAGIDIQIGSDTPTDGFYPDAKQINGAVSGDTVSLTAQAIGAGAASFPMNGTYSWQIVGSYDGVSIVNAASRTASLVLSGNDEAIPVRLTYTLDGREYVSEVTIYTTTGAEISRNTVIDFGLPVSFDVNASGIQ